jgi:hypothetical protein
MLLEYKMEDEICRACNTQEIKGNLFKISMRNTEGKISPRRHMRILRNNIKMDLKVI